VSLPNYPWQRERFWIERAQPKPSPLPGQLDALLRQLAQRGTLSSLAQSALPEILAALADEQARAAREPPSRSWQHALAWRSIVPPQLRAALNEGPWLVVGPPQEAQALQSALRKSERRAQVASFEQLPGLLENMPGLSGVICLLEEAAPENQMLAIERWLASSASAPRAWWITRGAVGTSSQDPPTQPTHAVLWGLGRTFALEHPKTWGGLLDLPSGPLSAAIAERAVAALLGVHEEDQLALRGNELLAPRIVAQLPEPSPSPRISGRGTALISGGLGVLGLHVARWLVRNGVRNLLLLGRQGLASPGAPAAVSELQSLGARVTVAAVDVADQEAMSRVLAGIAADAPLTSVFHVAGVSDLTRLEELTPERLSVVLEAKRKGTWVLDALTCDRPLEAFVCFSSIAGVWGAGGQAAYAAANAFLDAWAHSSRARGRPAFSVSWGPWAEGGMADAAAQAQLQRRGLYAMNPTQALDALEQVLRSAPSHTAIVHVDWQAFRKSFEAWGPRGLLREVVAPETTHAAQPSSRHPLAEALASLSPAERTKYLRAWITKQCAQLLGHRTEVPLDPDRGFFDLGLDSLMVVELRSSLEKNLGQRISPSVAFSHPSIGALVDYLLRASDSPSQSSAAEAPLRETSVQASEGQDTPSPNTDEELVQFINSRFTPDDD